MAPVAFFGADNADINGDLAENHVIWSSRWKYGAGRPGRPGIMQGKGNAYLN